MDKHCIQLSKKELSVARVSVSILQFPQADRGGSHGIDLLIKAAEGHECRTSFSFSFVYFVATFPRQFTFSAWSQPIAVVLCGKLVVDAEHSAG